MVITIRQQSIYHHMWYLTSVYNLINHNSVRLQGKERELEDTCKPLRLSSSVQDESSKHVEIVQITWILFLPWSPSSLPSSASHISLGGKARLFHHKSRALSLSCLQSSFSRWAFFFPGEDTVPTACNLPWCVTDTLVANVSVALGWWLRFYHVLALSWGVVPLPCASFQSLGSAHSPLLRATFIFICYLFSWLMKLHPSGCQNKMLKKN